MRRDIQALRAIAVLMVIANHLFPGRFVGGYVGVDVFFVISGYLITAHLLREADGTGRVKLGSFWARRARRLLPAALLVLAVCAIVVYLRAPLAVWQQNFAQIAVAAVYGLNWRLAFQSLNYFDQGLAQTTVIHYWSLSVEEQFYLVWPLIVLAVYLLARRQPLARRRMIVGIAFGVILLASFAWATYATATQPSAAYFETTDRAWEFAAGGLLSMIPAFGSALRTRLVPLVWVAWGVLVAGVFVIGQNWGVPGPASLIPVAATGVVLVVGESEAWFGTRYVTGLWPVRTIGDISYSAYLWHWPLIVALPWFLGSSLTTVDKLIILVATLIIAWLSKRYVEDPVRLGRPATWRPRLAIPAALLAMAIVFGGSGLGAFAVHRQGAAAADQIAADVQTMPHCFGMQASITRDFCPHSHVLSPRGSLLLDGIWNFQGANETDCVGIDDAGSQAGGCSFGVPAGTQKMNIALTGDSHAYMWAPALEEIAKRYSARIFVYTKGSCSLTANLNTEFVDQSRALNEACNVWRTRTINALVASHTINLIITSSRARSYFTRDGTGTLDNGTGYASVWKRWLASGKAVIAIADTPAYETSPQQCIATNSASADPCASPASVVAGPTPLSAAAATISNPHFAFANLSPLFCGRICHSVIGGLPVTRDGQHITSFLAQSFGASFLRAQFDKVLGASMLS